MTMRNEMRKRHFPKKLHNCFECKTRITNTTRKRIVMGRTRFGCVVYVGYQLCRSCAELFQAKEFHALPVISRDVNEADFQFGFIGHVGGMQ